MRGFADRLHAGPFRDLIRELARAASWHRRPLAAGVAAVAVVVGLTAMEPDPAPSSQVLTAARDLPSGTRLTASDLRTTGYPDAIVPAGAATSRQLIGRVLAAPVRRGEPLTDRRVLGPGLLDGYGDGLVAAPVRITDPGVLAFVRVGGTVDVLAAESTTANVYASTRTLARDVPVVALPRNGNSNGTAGLGGLGGLGTTGLDGGGLVVLGVPPSTAAELTRAAVTAHVSLALRE